MFYNPTPTDEDGHITVTHNMMEKAHDDEKGAVLYELDRRVRRSFVDRWVGAFRLCNFALALQTARWDTCVKDIERGHVLAEDWQRVLADAVKSGVLTPDCAQMVFGRFMTPEPQMEETDEVLR